MSTAGSTILLGALALSSACTGAISEATAEESSRPDETGQSAPARGAAPAAAVGGATPPGVPSTAAATCKPTPGGAPIRRLSRFEYDNSIRDLLGDDSRPAQALPADEANGGFSNQAEIAMGLPDTTFGQADWCTGPLKGLAG